MVTFAGVDHVGLTVTDLEASKRFYTEVLDFIEVMNVGYARLLAHPATGFVLAVARPDEAHGGPFTELATGLDHLGFTAGSREELEEWQRRFDEHGVEYTPIRDMEFGYHLNFRDPDGIALEFFAAGPLMLAAQQALADGMTSKEDVAAFVAENINPDFVSR